MLFVFISRDETNFFIRCKDHKDKPEADRNEMKQSYPFSLRGSTELKILNLQPNGTIYGSVNPAPVELYTETLFGCDEGKAICYYSSDGDDGDYNMFFDTNTDDGIHTQRLDLGDGGHKYYYKCIDSGGNILDRNGLPASGLSSPLNPGPLGPPPPLRKNPFF